MSKRPVLALPKPTVRSYKGKAKPIKDQFARPEHGRHVNLLTPQFLRLKSYFEEQMKIQIRAQGAEPEQVVVLETIGSVSEFIVAAQNIQGLELLGEWEEEDIPPDDDFFKINNSDERADGNLSGCLYLVMLNQRAMNELLSLWDRYAKNPELQFGFGKARLKEIFQKLKNVRLWGPEDRMIERGGLDVWAKGLHVEPSGMITVQVEFWYRQSESIRQKAVNALRGLLVECGGKLQAEYTLQEIQYHAALVALPPSEIKKFLDQKPVKLIQFEQIMFVRAAAQHIVNKPTDEVSDVSIQFDDIMPELPPVVALLDGMPLQNHSLLAGRLMIDDPDDVASRYPSLSRHHGTAMASLILYGDLHKKGTPLNSKLYVRPIFQPSANGEKEFIPENTLPVAIINQAIHRMFEPTGEHPPSAPSVKIVNLSVGDSARPFDLFPSPLARLLDWLAFKFNILFIVSAGNYAQNIEVAEKLPATDRVEATIKYIASDIRNRRLLAPAESINALTVGAAHHDESNKSPIGDLVDLLPEPKLVSPVSAVGFGFRRSVKPDLLVPGGRQFYRPTYSPNIFSITESARFGQLVAAPGNIQGDLHKQHCIRGTSGATALATRAAGKTIEVLQQLKGSDNFSSLSDKFFPLAAKALVVHSSDWGESYKRYEKVLKTSQNSRRFREYITRFLGYGTMTSEALAFSRDEKATMLGWGEIEIANEHTFEIPLPPSLAGKKIWKRLSITLAWFSPVNAGHRAYRKAALSFDPPQTELQVKRKQVDHHAVRRGTIQHEILEGDEAVAFRYGDTLRISILCQEKAGTVSTKIPYVVAATVEVAEGEGLPIWEEIRDILIEIRQKLGIQTKV